MIDVGNCDARMRDVVVCYVGMNGVGSLVLVCLMLVCLMLICVMLVCLVLVSVMLGCSMLLFLSLKTSTPSSSTTELQSYYLVHFQ